MGLFNKKPMYKYKPLEKVKIDIDEVNAVFLATNQNLKDYDEKEYCELIGETIDYRIYIYRRKVSNYGGYFLRQEKSSPKKVTYLGTARKHCCIFKDKLFTINSSSSIGDTYHPLICKDIVTGEQTELKILSNKGYMFFGTSMHLHCQDEVHSLEIHDDVMILEVYRYPADSVLTKDTFFEECIYYIHIRYVDGKFTAERVFPKGERTIPEKPYATPGCDAGDLREKVTAKGEKISQESTTYNYMDIAAELLAIGRKEGQVVSEGLPFVPELLNMCVETCIRLFEKIQEYGKTNPNANTLRLSLAWSTFAGMGAVYHWHTDWTTLSHKGLFKTLTEERGVYEMDEYVLDLIGIQHDDFHGKMTGHLIIELANKCINILEEKFAKPSAEVWIEAAKAMFIYGMVFEMNRLGMK